MESEKIIRITIVLFLAFVRTAFAQDPPRFQPPRPPQVEEEYEDDDDSDIDQPATRTQNAVPGQQTPATTSAPAPDFNPPPTAAPTPPDKVRFKIVEGEFWEKGKPRGRTSPNRHSQQ